MAEKFPDKSFQLGDWQVEPQLNQISRDNRIVPLENKTMDVLVLLAAHAGDVVSNDEIIDAVWAGRPMGENPVYKAITNLRKALGDDSKNPDYVATIARKGYRLIAAVERVDERPVSPPTKKARWPVAAALLVFLGIGTLLVGKFVDVPDQDVSIGDQSIAVLPFENLSGEAENGLFCRGVAETLLNRLAAVPNLRVVARKSAFSLVDIDVRDVIKQLNVRYVLAGSLQQQGDSLRITARLVNVSGDIVWSESFDRDNANVFDIQNEIAQAVVRGIPLDDEALLPVAGAPTDNFEAYKAYLLGNEHSRRRPNNWTVLAIDAYNEAIRLDPGFAQPYAGLATALAVRGMNDVKTITDALAAAEMSLRLDPDLPEGLAVTGLLLTREDNTGGYQASLEWLERAIELNPSLIDARNWLSISYSVLGRRQESIDVLSKALELDPLNPTLNTNLGARLHFDGRLDAAREQFQKLFEYPDVPSYSYEWIAAVEVSAGDYTAALEWIKLGGLNGGFGPESVGWYVSRVAQAYARLGMFDDANRWMALDNMMPGSHWSLAANYAVLGFQKRYEELAVMAAEHLESYPDQANLTNWSRQLLAGIALENGDYLSTIKYLERDFGPGWELYNGPGGRSGQFAPAQQLAMAYLQAGREDDAARVLDELLVYQLDTRSGRTRVISPYLIDEAVTYALQGNEAVAAERLRQAVDAGWRDYYGYLADSRFRPLDDLDATAAIIEEVRRDIEAQRERVIALERQKPFDLPPGATASQ